MNPLSLGSGNRSSTRRAILDPIFGRKPGLRSVQNQSPQPIGILGGQFQGDCTPE